MVFKAIEKQVSRKFSFLGLTNREEEVADLVSRGMTNKAIGYFLGISEQTVKNHITGIRRALNATSRVEMVIKLIRGGLDIGVPNSPALNEVLVKCPFCKSRYNMVLGVNSAENPET